MAACASTARFLISRATSSRIFHQLLQPRPHDSPPIHSHFLRNFHFFVSREFHSRSFQNLRPAFSKRSMVSAPDQSLDESSTAATTALGLDNRVPATIITGFLGSGKVRFFFYFTFGFLLFRFLLFGYRESVGLGISCGVLLAMQTTLLNHILTSQHGKRIAVIENEVHEIM